ncbi:MAG: hypothetical protein DHS20C20_25250 [Ardenticatenaceae bacterium]|nr:MAG: hypothetical protein DHS20C20_25250 [Ardenticatenaceae bacterium]
MTKQTPFQKFEALAQLLVEGSFNRIFGGNLSTSDVATELARVVENSAIANEAPAQYTIRLHPASFEQLLAAEPDIIDQLTRYLSEFVLQAELTLSRTPHLTLVADPAVGEKDVVIEPIAARRPSDHTVTQIRHQEDGASLFAADIAALDAYLIVDGQRHVPLTKPVTNLGRNTDNDVVLDAPTVSRKHAQIRWRYGRFILYDVSNRGRTKVNSQLVSETVLKSGDVIALSEVLLIYGEGETQPRPSPRSTTQLNDETQIRPPDAK